MRRPLTLYNVVLAMILTLAAGCRLDVVTTVDVVDRDRARVDVAVTLDPTLLAELDELGVDPTAELEAAAASDDSWELARTVGDDGSLTLTLQRELPPAEVGGALRDLAAGLRDGDPGLDLDLELAVTADGAVTLEGTGSVRPAATSGVALDGTPVGPGTDELTALTEQTVVARLDVIVPGDIVTTSAARTEGPRAVFELPVATTTSLDLTADAPDRWAALVPLAAAVAAGVVVVGLGVWAWRRRRRRR